MAVEAGAGLDLSVPRSLHIVAVGGAGMSGIATLLAQIGHTVSGSDERDSPVLDELRALGVVVVVGHDATNVGDVAAVVASTAVGADNVEILEAVRRDIPVLRRIDLLPALARLRPLVSVSGTHGKTTTSAMLSVALRAAGDDSSYLVGANVAALDGAAAWNHGRYLVLEADESDGSFLAEPRAAAIVTNIEPDHLEFWGGWKELVDGFRRFLVGTDGPRVVCSDDRGSAALAAELRSSGVEIVTYGFDADADHRIDSLRLDSEGSEFELAGVRGPNVAVQVRVPGRHNALNAAGALAVVAELAAAGEPSGPGARPVLDPAAAAVGLGHFTGVSRRFERRGVAAGVTVVDDYAHLPTEVRSALAAGRSGGWARVVAVFQPHRYSRTAELWRDFADSFDEADVLVLTDIYPAGEAPREGVTGKLLVDAVLDRAPWRQLAWMPTLDDVTLYLTRTLRPGDLCLTLGAGDVTTVGDRVLSSLRSRVAEADEPAGPLE